MSEVEDLRGLQVIILLFLPARPRTEAILPDCGADKRGGAALISKNQRRGSLWQGHIGQLQSSVLYN